MDCDCFYWTAFWLVAGRLYDTPGPAQIKEIPAYSGVAATRLYAERGPKTGIRNPKEFIRNSGFGILSVFGLRPSEFSRVTRHPSRVTPPAYLFPSSFAS